MMLNVQVLEQIKVQKEMDRATLVDVSRTSLRTKVHSDLADLLTEVNFMSYIDSCSFGFFVIIFGIFAV